MSVTTVRRLLGAWWRDPNQFRRPLLKRDCPMCGYHGIFISVGRPSRHDVRCVQCGCRERHRLMWLWITESGVDKLKGKRILHFAPESAWIRKMKNNPLYETADLYQRGVDHRVDIMNIPFEGGCYDVVIANHVLEHVDEDETAIREVYRILKKDGIALITVPINTSRQNTYRNPTVFDAGQRLAHFGGTDHKRYYGLDFADILGAHGFAVETFRMLPEQEVRYGLLRNEWIYIARK